MDVKEEVCPTGEVAPAEGEKRATRSRTRSDRRRRRPWTERGRNDKTRQEEDFHKRGSDRGSGNRSLTEKTCVTDGADSDAHPQAARVKPKCRSGWEEHFSHDFVDPVFFRSSPSGSRAESRSRPEIASVVEKIQRDMTTHVHFNSAPTRSGCHENLWRSRRRFRNCDQRMIAHEVEPRPH